MKDSAHNLLFYPPDCFTTFLELTLSPRNLFQAQTHPLSPKISPFSDTKYLYFQTQTMDMMYKMISKAISKKGPAGARVTDYLNFYALGTRVPLSEACFCYVDRADWWMHNMHVFKRK